MARAPFALITNNHTAKLNFSSKQQRVDPAREDVNTRQHTRVLFKRTQTNPQTFEQKPTQLARGAARWRHSRARSPASNATSAVLSLPGYGVSQIAILFASRASICDESGAGTCARTGPTRTARTSTVSRAVSRARRGFVAARVLRLCR